MIILDTNVISELMKDDPDQAVANWLDAQDLRALFSTTISLMELHYGIHRLPGGKRKEVLWEVLHFTLAKLFSDRILDFDRHAALAAAKITSQTTSRGVNLGTADLQIAGIATSRRFFVATRDELPFVETGVNFINPWQFES